MAEDDPVATLLKRSALSTAQRADMWDAYQQSASPEDFAERVKGMGVPDPVKADLFDLKAGQTPKTTEQAKPAEGHPWINAAADLLPTAGGIAGGIIGGIGGTAFGVGVGGVPGAVGGATLGGATGEAARQLIREATGGPVPTMTQAAKGMAEQGAAQGAGELAGAGVVAGAGGLSKWLMNRATSRVTAQLAREFPELSDTLIDNALTVSQGGYGKALGLLKTAKAKATATLIDAEKLGAQVPVQLTPELADSLKTAILEKAIKAGQIAAPKAGAPVTTATERLSGPMKQLFQQIDLAADGSIPLLLKPTEADLFKTQLQKESRALYLNRVAQNGPKAMGQSETLMADYAAKLNSALDGVAQGYKAANAEAQPLIGAVRGLKQAIRPSGNLYQAMVRPAFGAVTGGMLGQREGGSTGAALGTIAGAAMTSPAGMSREAIILAHPAMRAVLQQLPKPIAQKLMDALGETLNSPAAPSSAPEPAR